jgi:hypothetical protein
LLMFLELMATAMLPPKLFGRRIQEDCRMERDIE